MTASTTFDARAERMNRSTEHALTPVRTRRDRARQAFAFHLKRQLGAFSADVLRQIAERSDRDPATALTRHPAFAAWTALNKGSQRRMWLAIEDMIRRQWPRLNRIADEIASLPPKGSLRLDPNLSVPPYLAQHAFHGQPGGYVACRDERDFMAGLLQEAGGALYTRGAGTGAKDSKGLAVLRYLSARFPDLAPRRILDLGCGYGGQTCAYALAFPQARTFGIDVGAGLLRFAHLRAESLKVPLHLEQRDAARTGYPDGHFDLVVSNILLHEMPREARHEVMVECRRLLAPGGVAIHQDIPMQNRKMSRFFRFIALWQTAHNDEPFWEDFADDNLPKALARAGFSESAIFEDYVPQTDGPLNWYFAGAVRD